MFLLELFNYVPVLLTLFWALAIWAVLVTLMPVPMPQAFKDAVKLSAARGKLWSIRPTTLGALNNIAVPQSWFSHFYAIGLACCTLLVLVCTSSVKSQGFTTALGPRTFIGLFLFMTHLLRRLLETVYMMVYPKDSRMHLIAYVFGLAYYVVAPLSIVHDTYYTPSSTHEGSLLQWWTASTATAQGVPASCQQAAMALAHDAASAPSLLLASVAAAVAQAPVLTVLGCTTMIAGFIIQCHSHWVLARLAGAASKQQQQQQRAPATFEDSIGDSSKHTAPSQQLSDPSSTSTTGVRSRPAAAAATLASQKINAGTDTYSAAGSKVAAAAEGYKVPEGGMFDLVSCPHYLGEITIYLGLALVTAPSVRPSLMLLWVVVNLVLAAGPTHQWYKATFPSYPANRRALVPWLY